MNSEIKSARRSSMTLLEGLVLFIVLCALVWLIAWGVQRTKRQAERSHAKKVLREAKFILVLDQKDHVARSTDLAGTKFEHPMMRSTGTPFERHLLKQLALFDEAHVLQLPNSLITDDELKMLTSLTHLRELDISGSLVTDEGLEALIAFRELEELDITLTKVRGPGLRHLRSLGKLRTLRVTNNEIPDSALPYLEALTQLKSVDVDRTWLSDKSKEKLNSIRIRKARNLPDRFQQLVEASVSDLRDGPNIVDVTAYEAIEVSHALNTLSSAWPRNRVQVVIPPDGKITRLALRNADLRLPRFPSSSKGNDYRLRFPHLQYLNLSHTRFDEKRSPAFGLMDDLRELNIVASDCGDKAFGQLRGCSRLKTLDARVCGLTDESLVTIGSLTRLETVRLGQNYFTDSSLKELLKLKQLERLELDSCDITDTGLGVLAKLPKLRYLSLSRTYVTRDGIAKLKKARPGIDVRLTGVSAVANTTDSLVGQFNLNREAPIIRRLEPKGFRFQIEGSYGRVIAVRFPDDYQATDEDMKWLGRLTGMRDFRGEELSEVTAQGVRELAELAELKYVYLKSPRLDRSTLDELLRFRDLERAYLYGTSITEEDVEEFRKKYPRHDVDWNSSYVRIFFDYHTDQ
jgi:Leucine-rich repeat (LRR) protein